MGWSMKRSRVLAATVLVGAISLALAPASRAITHTAAVKVALRALQPGKLKGPVKVFSLPQPLPRGQFVYERVWREPTTYGRCLSRCGSSGKIGPRARTSRTRASLC